MSLVVADTVLTGRVQTGHDNLVGGYRSNFMEADLIAIHDGTDRAAIAVPHLAH